MLTVTLISLGVLLLLAGLVGCILPIIPGPPLSFAGLVCLWWARDFEATSFDETTVIIAAVAAAVSTVLDYVTPALGAKKFGASKLGVWGSVIGMIVGIIWFPPFGMLIGAFLGAMLGELFAGKEGSDATKAAIGVFLGTVLGIVIKMVASGWITWVFAKELWYS
jgi:uncharacterized protein YqgC (DUF456 family)